MSNEFPYEFYEVSCKRFVSEKEDGTGNIMVFDRKSAQVNCNDCTKKGMTVRKLYREVMKGIK